MRQSSGVWTYTLGAVVLIAGVALLWHQRNQGEAVAADRAFASRPAPQADTRERVPMDVLGTGVVSWMPATGNGAK